jgi:hypothetical protein
MRLWDLFEEEEDFRTEWGLESPIKESQQVWYVVNAVLIPDGVFELYYRGPFRDLDKAKEEVDSLWVPAKIVRKEDLPDIQVRRYQTSTSEFKVDATPSEWLMSVLSLSDFSNKVQVLEKVKALIQEIRKRLGGGALAAVVQHILKALKAVFPMHYAWFEREINLALG